MEMSMKLRMKMSALLTSTVRKAAVFGFAAVALSVFAVSARADNLVTNGNFEETSPIVGAGNPSSSNGGQLTYNLTATGWTNAGYTFLYTSAAAAGAGVSSQYGPNDVAMWGPGNGSNNGFNASPAGGNFIASDPAYLAGSISQTITGLTKGDTYTVGFYFAGAQQAGYTGATTEGWQVSFGSETQSTPILNNANHGFTGWFFDSFTFTANGTSDVLSFLALGGPPGVPPFALLDGVSVSAPEPGSATLTLTGLGMMGALLLLASKKLAIKRQ